jgi:hypothetical protein
MDSFGRRAALDAVQDLGDGSGVRETVISINDLLSLWYFFSQSFAPGAQQQGFDVVRSLGQWE